MSWITMQGKEGAEGELAEVYGRISPDDGPVDNVLAIHSLHPRSMVDWALKLTRTPGRMSESDLLPLRKAGLDDRAILDLAMIVGYYAYVNRLASGLGVSIEEAGPEHPLQNG